MVKKSFPKPGWRVIKTAIAIFCCLIIYHFIFHRQNPMVACLSAVFSMRENVSLSYNFGKSRIISNGIGGLYAVLLVFIVYYPHYHQWLELIFLPLALMLFILTMLYLNNKAGIINGAAALLMIFFTTATSHPLYSALLRFGDTIIGAFVAFLVNYFIHRPKQKSVEEQKIAIEKQIEKLQQQLDEL